MKAICIDPKIKSTAYIRAYFKIFRIYKVLEIDIFYDVMIADDQKQHVWMSKKLFDQHFQVIER